MCPVLSSVLDPLFRQKRITSSTFTPLWLWFRCHSTRVVRCILEEASRSIDSVGMTNHRDVKPGTGSLRPVSFKQKGSFHLPRNVSERVICLICGTKPAYISPRGGYSPPGGYTPHNYPLHFAPISMTPFASETDRFSRREASIHRI